MGYVNNIAYDRFPQQRDSLEKEVKVYFHYDTSKFISGVIVRNDSEEPRIIIIKLNNGKYVLGSECQFSIIR